MSVHDLTQRLAPASDRWNGGEQEAHALEWETQRRILLERALAERERELSDFLENALEGLVKVGPDGAIFWVNAAGLELLGCDAARCVGRRIEDFHLEPEDARRSLRRLLTGESLRNHATALRRGDGSIRHVRIAARALWDAGRLIHSRWFIRDVTHEWLAEEALREGERRRDEFLAVLAHELRNPLAPIRYAVALARRQGRPEAERNQAQAIIERQVAHMGRLLDDLLDVSRITRGLLTLRLSSVELAAVLAAAQESARPLIESKHHTLTVTLPRERERLVADPVRVAQILSNLLINAAQYTDRGGRIELRVQRDRDELVFTVRDNGIGISPEMMPRIFTLFVQATPALERAEGGLGIGLALVQGLVELHGGSVAARSEGPGRGSEFVVRLPIGHPACAEANEQAPGGAPTGSAPLRVLVADDNCDSAATCAAFLQACGHDVSVANSGGQAYDLACNLRPDALLLDVGMPELNGYQLAERIRATDWGRGTVLIAITGWGQEQDKQRALAAGFDRHVTKPVDPRRLESLLRGTRTPPQAR